MKIAVPQERAPGERRVALVPDVVAKLIAAGHTVTVERGAGAAAFYPDAAYEKAGAALADGAAVYAGAEIVARVARPSDDEVAAIPRGATLVGFLAPLGDPRSVERYAAAGLSALAMELIPRTTLAQSMDALSSQASIGGYKAVLLAAEALPEVLSDADHRGGHGAAGQGVRHRRGRRGPAGPGHRAPARRGGHRLRRAHRGQGTGPVAGREVLRDRPASRRPARAATRAS